MKSIAELWSGDHFNPVKSHALGKLSRKLAALSVAQLTSRVEHLLKAQGSVFTV